MDCDVYGPSIPLMMGVRGRPTIEGESLVPVENLGIKTMSMGLLVDENTPVVWRGPMVNKTIQQFAQNVNWGNLDVLVVDLPPGTGDAYLTVMKDINIDDFILVTSNNKLAISDSLKTLTMAEKFNINVFGYIENHMITNSKPNDENIFNLIKINYLGSVNFDSKIYNFDTNYVPDDIIALSEKILSTINKI